MGEHEPRGFDPGTNEDKEKIEDGIWRPGILEAHSAEVAAAASTKVLRRTEEIALRILGDSNRFTKPMRDRIRAGRILAQLRDTIHPAADLHNIVKAQLAHSGEVKKIDEDFVRDLVKGNLDKKQIHKTDGLITNLKDYPLYVSAADCYPVGIYDPENNAIGAFHNGIYGLMNRITENGLAAMVKEYGTDPSKIKVVIAPGISEQYLIAKDMVEKYQDKFKGFELNRYIQETGNPDMVRFDLGNAIKDSLIQQGVREENIELSEYHTDTHNSLFPSERVEGNKDRDSYGFMIVLK
jgi:YfiH family protein